MMTFSLSVNVRKFTNQAISAMLMAVLIASGLGGALPTLLTGSANAVADTTYGNVSLTSGWSVDRTAPSGGYGVTEHAGRQAMRLGVTPPSTASSSFYQFEGIKKTITPSTTVRADLYIDSSWPADVRPGIWGAGYNADNQLVTYPIVEYNGSTATHWRTYDSAAGAWRNIDVANTKNGWNTIELAINKQDPSRTDIHVNGLFAGQSLGYAMKSIGTIFLNNYVSTMASAPYSIYWSNIETGVYNPNPPTNLRFIRDNKKPVTIGSTINFTDVRLLWDTVAGAERYQIKVTAPDNTSQAGRQQGWYIFDLSDATRYGHFGTQQGTWTYQVRTKDATTGLWSAYTSPLSLNYDSTAPSVSLTAARDGNTVNLPTSESKTSPVDTPVLMAKQTTFTANLEDVSGSHGAYIELFKTNYNGTYGTWKADNSSSTTRYGSSPKLSVNLANYQGNYGIKIVAKDNIGNSETRYAFFTVDGKLPVANLTSQLPLYVNSDFIVSGIATDNNALSNAFFDVRKDNTLVAGCINGTLSRSFAGDNKSAQLSCTIGTSNLVDGQTYTLRIHASDKAGYGSVNPEAKHTFTMDRSAPKITYTSPVQSTTYGGVMTVSGNIANDTIDASGTIGNEVTIHLRKVKSNGKLDGDINIQTATVQADGSWSTALNTQDYTDGAYGLTAFVTDAAGNSSVATGTSLKPFFIDNTAPEVVIVDYSVNGDKVTPSVTVNDASDLEYSWTTNSNLVNISDDSVLEPTFTVSQIGVYEFTLTVADSSGNSTTKSFTFTKLPSSSLEPLEDSPSTTPLSGANAPSQRQLTSQQNPRTSSTGASTPGQVLGASTATPNTVAAETGSNDVKGVTTTQDDDKKVENSAFLGLGWWWLPIAVVLVAFFGLFAARRRVEQ